MTKPELPTQGNIFLDKPKRGGHKGKRKKDNDPGTALGGMEVQIPVGAGASPPIDAQLA